MLSGLSITWTIKLVVALRDGDPKSTAMIVTLYTDLSSKSSGLTQNTVPSVMIKKNPPYHLIIIKERGYFLRW